MLVKLLSDQVARNWEEIKVAIKRSAPVVEGESPEKYNNILERMLIGKMDCWLSYNEEKVMDTLITTYVIEDEIGGTRSLMIYSVTGIGPVSLKSWIEGIKTLKDYGKSLGCNRLMAYSCNEFILKIAEKNGGDSSWHLVTIPTEL